MNTRQETDFERARGSAPRGGIAGELWHLLRTTGKWWLLPFLLIMLPLGGLMLLSSTAAAPFIYTLF